MTLPIEQGPEREEESARLWLRSQFRIGQELAGGNDGAEHLQGHAKPVLIGTAVVGPRPDFSIIMALTHA